MLQYFTKGAANLCGMVEIINEDFADEALKKEVEDRLMPRTEELPLYSTHEFNDKVGGGGGGCRSGVLLIVFRSLFFSFSLFLLISRSLDLFPSFLFLSFLSFFPSFLFFTCFLLFFSPFLVLDLSFLSPALSRYVSHASSCGISLCFFFLHALLPSSSPTIVLFGIVVKCSVVLSPQRYGISPTFYLARG